MKSPMDLIRDFGLLLEIRELLLNTNTPFMYEEQQYGIIIGVEIPNRMLVLKFTPFGSNYFLFDYIQLTEDVTLLSSGLLDLEFYEQMKIVAKRYHPYL